MRGIRVKRNIVLILVGLVIFIYFIVYSESGEEKSEIKYFDNDLGDHEEVVERFYDKRKHWNTSNLGSILFKNEKHQTFIRQESKNKTFLVLFWQYWDWQKNRHVYNFGSQNNDVSRVLEDCSVKNCKFTGKDEEIDSADAVIIHMQRKKIPKVVKRNTKQRWIFLSDESPINTFSLGKNSKLTWSDMSNVFNWTMTYRSDSDVPVPYGRTVPLQNPMTIDKLNVTDSLTELVPYWSEKKFEARAMILTSNCMGDRMHFVHGLQNFIEVDVYGGCADKPENKKKCPGHFRSDCMLPASYLFYLVLENSKCRQYITEKVFQHAYSKGAIPIIMGPSVDDCKNLLPPNSFLHVDNYESINKLAEDMIRISKREQEIRFFHAWRRHFAIVNEHGYFKTRSYHLCRVCEALNYNDVNVKSYTKNDLDLFFNKELLCDLKESLKFIYE